MGGGEGRKKGKGRGRQKGERERKGDGEVGYRCQLVLAWGQEQQGPTEEEADYLRADFFLNLIC